MEEDGKASGERLASDMTDLFESPKQLIAWADKNIIRLKGQTAAFFENEPCITFCEPYPKRLEWQMVKARLQQPLPDDFSEMVADILDNLRSALDQTIYAIAIA